MAWLTVLVWGLCFVFPLVVVALASGARGVLASRWPWLAAATLCAAAAAVSLSLPGYPPVLTVLLASAAGAAVAQAFAPLSAQVATAPAR